MNERQAILESWKQSSAAALATVVEVRGSAYRRPGARMLLTQEGKATGMVNGGCLDADLWRRAREVMASQNAQLACYDSTAPEDILWGLGLGCRGVVKVLLEPVTHLDWMQDGNTVAVHYEGEFLGTQLWHEPVARPQIIEAATGRIFLQPLKPPQSLFIFGAGADAVPLYEMGRTLGWEVQVIDLRSPHPERLAYLPANHVSPEQLSELKLSPGAACIIMTHNFLHDLEVLKFALRSDAIYIGILGPRRRTDDLIERLERNTIQPALQPTEAQLSRIHGPIGLDLGAETPEEIALSVLAEVQKTMTRKTGLSLRERDSIH